MPTDLEIDVDDGVNALARIASACGRAGINIEGFSLTASDRGATVHLLVDNPAAARDAFSAAGYAIAAERGAMVLPGVEDRPGFLGEIAGRLAGADVEVGAAYLATNTRLAFAVADIDRARQAL